MREHGILFKGEMVRGLLSGQKTMTRRLVKLDHSGRAKRGGKCWHLGDPEVYLACPYGQPGDRLWVKETFCCVHGFGGSERTAQDALVFRADDGEDAREITKLRCWTSSLLMPRIYSRILLEITATRVERLQSITEEDAIAEGIELAHPGTTSTWWKDYEAKPTPDALQDPYHGLAADPVESFASLWRSLNGRDSWNANPWVWVVEFRRIAP